MTTYFTDGILIMNRQVLRIDGKRMIADKKVVVTVVATEVSEYHIDTEQISEWRKMLSDKHKFWNKEEVFLHYMSEIDPKYSSYENTYIDKWETKIDYWEIGDE